MENVKFIKEIISSMDEEKIIAGNAIYVILNDKNRIKLYCSQCGVEAEIINVVNGKIDTAYFPFANYFEPTQCSERAPKWTQNIEYGKWRYSTEYSHVIPTEEDFKNLTDAIIRYMDIFR